jgi:Domain of unknown function (DUF4265)
MNHVKILFGYSGPDDIQSEVEGVWAIPDSAGYIIDNIPFYIKSIALEDMVSARQGADGQLWFETLLEPSGHSTVRLWFDSATDVQRIRDELRALGCRSELSELPRLVAVDIPPNVPYSIIRPKLEEGERAGYFEYEEACLAQTSEA